MQFLVYPDGDIDKRMVVNGHVPAGRPPLTAVEHAAEAWMLDRAAPNETLMLIVVPVDAEAKALPDQREDDGERFWKVRCVSNCPRWSGTCAVLP